MSNSRFITFIPRYRSASSLRYLSVFFRNHSLIRVWRMRIESWIKGEMAIKRIYKYINSMNIVELIMELWSLNWNSLLNLPWVRPRAGLQGEQRIAGYGERSSCPRRQWPRLRRTDCRVPWPWRAGRRRGGLSWSLPCWSGGGVSSSPCTAGVPTNGHR